MNRTPPEASVRHEAYSFINGSIAKAIIEARKHGRKVEAVLNKSHRTDKYTGATFLMNEGCNLHIDARHDIAHNKLLIIDERSSAEQAEETTGQRR